MFGFVCLFAVCLPAGNITGSGEDGGFAPLNVVCLVLRKTGGPRF